MTHLCSSSPSKDKSLGKNWERLRMNTKSTEHQQHDGIIFPSLQCNLPVQLCNAHCLRLIPVKVAVVDKILFSGALSSTIRLHYTTASKHNLFKNNQQKRVDCLKLVCHTNKNLLNFFAELGCPLPGHWPASRSTDIVEELERVCMFLILNHQDIEVILERLSVWYWTSKLLLDANGVNQPGHLLFKLPQND